MMSNVPNLLSALRLVLAPVMLVLAWSGHPNAFLGCLIVSLFSDLADGFVARHFGKPSVLGAKLDSWGDLAMYLTLPPCIWWLWPDVILAELPFVALALASFVLPTLIGLMKFKRFTSYHTYGAKFSAVVMGVAMLLLFTGQTPWPFRIGAAIFALAEIEEIAITAVLSEWTSDVRSLWHALRLEGGRSARQPAGGG
jgi:CDP-diacylglycerol--glycerol-3-phosphate 3-phosphatidyltransferase